MSVKDRPLKGIWLIFPCNTCIFTKLTPIRILDLCGRINWCLLITTIRLGLLFGFKSGIFLDLLIYTSKISAEKVRYSSNMFWSPLGTLKWFNYTKKMIIRSELDVIADHFVIKHSFSLVSCTTEWICTWIFQDMIHVCVNYRYSHYDCNICWLFFFFFFVWFILFFFFIFYFSFLYSVTDASGSAEQT